MGERSSMKPTLSSAVPICSLKYCCVRAAKGVIEELGRVSYRIERAPSRGVREVLPECLKLVHDDAMSMGEWVYLNLIARCDEGQLYMDDQGRLSLAQIANRTS